MKLSEIRNGSEVLDTLEDMREYWEGIGGGVTDSMRGAMYAQARKGALMIESTFKHTTEEDMVDKYVFGRITACVDSFHAVAKLARFGKPIVNCYNELITAIEDAIMAFEIADISRYNSLPNIDIDVKG